MLGLLLLLEQVLLLLLLLLLLQDLLLELLLLLLLDLLLLELLLLLLLLELLLLLDLLLWRLPEGLLLHGLLHGLHLHRLLHLEREVVERGRVAPDGRAEAGDAVRVRVVGHQVVAAVEHAVRSHDRYLVVPHACSVTLLQNFFFGAFQRFMGPREGTRASWRCLRLR